MFRGKSVCLSHDSDFGGGRLSCDFEEENAHFSEYSTVSKTTKSKTVIRIFYETAKDKRFLPFSAKRFFLLLLLAPSAIPKLRGD